MTDQIPQKPFDKLATSLPLLWLSLVFLSGILFAGQVKAPVLDWLILAGAALFVAILLRIFSPRLHFSIAPFFLLIPALLAAFFAGASRYQVTIPKADAFHIAWYNDREYEVLVTGSVADPPDERDAYTNLRVDVTSVDTGDNSLPVHGLILARVQPGTGLHYGDVVRLRGHLKLPPENEVFSYRDYLDRQGIFAYMSDGKATRLPFSGGNPILRQVYAFKDSAIQHIYRLYPDPEASLLAGILLGNDNGMPASLQQAYKNTGTAHVIAISGFNIAIIAGLFVIFFSRMFGARKGAIFAVLGIVAFTLLVGASASVVSAAIMSSLAIFARQVGRRQHGINTLSFTAAAMAIINPHTLWDVGFQLAFAATLGLILYAQPFQDAFTGLLSRRLPGETAKKIAGPVAEYVLFTLAAQLTTLPIMAYHFGRISLVAIIANPFVLPVQPAVIVLAGLAMLLSFIYFPLGQVAAWVAWPLAAYTNWAVEFFNRFPHGVIVLGEFSLLAVVSFYAILFLLTFDAARVKQTLRPALAPAVLIAILGTASYLVWSAALKAPDGHLHLTFLNVGSADAVLIQTPSGRSILVNGGPSSSDLSNALGRRLPPFERQLDWLIVASTQQQEVAALARVLDRFPVENVMWSGKLEASYSAGQLDRWLAENEVPITQAYPGAVLDLGEGATLEVRSVSPRGSVLLITWHGFRALLPIGMNFDTLDELGNGQAIGPVTALLLADSGFAQTNPSEWIAALRPQVAVLSVAAGDPNSLPDPNVLDSLRGITLLRTDRNGWVQLATDGTKLWVEAEKK
jgi:competence protein ComEC